MKTPEEIKKLLANHREYTFNLKDLLDNALAYIQRLEREKDALLKELKVTDIYGDCETCMHRDAKEGGNCGEDGDCFFCLTCKVDYPCKVCLDGEEWEWIGVPVSPKEETKE